MDVLVQIFLWAQSWHPWIHHPYRTELHPQLQVDIYLYIYEYLYIYQIIYLTAGHPTLYFCYKSKPLFNTQEVFNVKVTIF